MQYLPLGALVGLILLVELVLVLGGIVLAPEVAANRAAPMPAASDLTNTQALGELLYTHYAYFFQAAGMILLVAMIGAIVLTHRSRVGVRRQDIAQQTARRPADTIEVRKVQTGSGI
jgi:NADH-quinone oxidoreductase subunit J